MKPKVIVITGATRGLGHSLVAPFVAAGHTVIGCGRSQKAIADLTKKHACVENRTLFEVVDVTDAGAVKAWANTAIVKFGAPDLLINNAAVMNKPAPVWSVPASEFDKMVDINIKGVANVIRAFVPAMVKEARGVIVNLSSAWGRSTARDVAPYCATKYAIEGLTLAMAKELPKGMAAVPLNPGIIDTDMLRECFGEGASSYSKADVWAESAVPFLLKLDPDDNGKSLSVR